MRFVCFSVVLALVAGCSEDPPDLGIPDREVCLMNRSGGRYCIDAFEASRRDATAADPGVDDAGGATSLEGRLPWVDITWAGALDACLAKGKRLCARDEWLDACDGAVGEGDGTTFTYGDMLDNARCNTSGDGAVASGSRSTCMGSTGTFDQSGNVWEWTGNTLAEASARGGSFRSSQTHHCTSPENPAVGDVVSPNGGRSSEVGFRCCRDQ